MVWPIRGVVFFIMLEVTQYTLAYVINVSCALPQIRVIDPAHRLEKGLHDCVKAIFRVLVTIFNS